MSDYFAQIQPLFDAILTGGVGWGSADPLTAQCALPSGPPNPSVTSPQATGAPWFRPNVELADLTDAGEPRQGLDRSYLWQPSAQIPLRLRRGTPPNPLEATSQYVISVGLQVGYIAGRGFEAFVHKIGTEVAAAVVLTPRQRAVADSLRIAKALTCKALWGSSATVPAITWVQQSGTAGPIQRVRGNWYVMTTPFEFCISVTNSVRNDP